MQQEAQVGSRRPAQRDGQQHTSPHKDRQSNYRIGYHQPVYIGISCTREDVAEEQA